MFVLLRSVGMWAEEEEDERPGFGAKKKGGGFTAPIGFVSGGIKQGDKTFKPGEDVSQQGFHNIQV